MAMAVRRPGMETPRIPTLPFDGTLATSHSTVSKASVPSSTERGSARSRGTLSMTYVPSEPNRPRTFCMTSR